MKLFLPFVIIAAVALLTAGIAARAYHEKMRPAPALMPGVEASPQPANTLEGAAYARGPRDAPVTLEIYGDFQCPPCAVVSKGIDAIQRQYEGRVRVVFREFPLEIHKHAKEAALAAEAAAIQGKFWEMHDELYENQLSWAEAPKVNSLFESYAEAIGLDVARFHADSMAPDVRRRVLADINAGDRRAVDRTPTVFVNGVRLGNSFSKDQLEKAIVAALPLKKNS
ncbi:MAG: thioredoxin domain-containing protein [Chthoniobacterales bacterium]|nr:thioredoxin domain-containing protein [Chthoniobacterales bacterium]